MTKLLGCIGAADDKQERELHEETGLKLAATELGPQIWQTEGRWDWADGQNHHTFVDYFFEIQIEQFEIDQSGWTDDERRDVLEIRWWKFDELIQTSESVGPPGLVEFLKHHLS
ncbi:MAG: NUDIX domain-containing protein [Micrococcales bacterium]